jgi:hypothetical protein
MSRTTYHSDVSNNDYIIPEVATVERVQAGEIVETLSKASWDAIPEDCKAIELDGRRVILRKSEEGATAFVTVQVEGGDGYPARDRRRGVRPRTS